MIIFDFAASSRGTSKLFVVVIHARNIRKRIVLYQNVVSECRKNRFFVLALVLRTTGRNVFRDNNEGTRAKLIINTLEIIHLVRMENFMGN